MILSAVCFYNYHYLWEGNSQSKDDVFKIQLILKTVLIIHGKSNRFLAPNKNPEYAVFLKGDLHVY